MTPPPQRTTDAPGHALLTRLRDTLTTQGFTVHLRDPVLASNGFSDLTHHSADRYTIRLRAPHPQDLTALQNAARTVLPDILSACQHGPDIALLVRLPERTVHPHLPADTTVIEYGHQHTLNRVLYATYERGHHTGTVHLHEDRALIHHHPDSTLGARLTDTLASHRPITARTHQHL